MTDVIDAPLPRLGDRALREAFGRFATGVTIITARDPGGQVIGMTANSFTSVSLQPALALFTVRKESRRLSVFQAADGYTINILDAEQQAVASRLGRPGDARLNPEELDTDVDALDVRGALAHLRCRPWDQYPAGDHVIFLASVSSIRLHPDGRPLVYFGGRFAALADDETT